MFISIIICSLNGEKVLPDCLRSVRETTYSSFEVIVVDNGSTDGTSGILEKTFPEVKVIRAPRNLGFAGGNNLGIKVAQGEIIVLLNDDTMVEPDWLTAAQNAAEHIDDWGILGAKLLYPDKKTLQHAGGTILPNALTVHIGNGEIDTGQYDEIHTCDYVTGAAFFIRRSVLEKIGMLDDRYFPIYFEEVDYCYQARKHGYGVYYIPDIKIYHYESRTTNKYSRGFLYKYHKNRIRFVLKNFTPRELLKSIKSEIRWLRHSHDTDLVVSLIKAYAMNLIQLPLTLWTRWKSP